LAAEVCSFMPPFYYQPAIRANRTIATELV
jgi:hypothetical protein